MAIQRLRIEQVQSQDPNQSHLGQQLSGMGTPHYQLITATEGQTNVTSNKPYQLGVGQLIVYLNGQKLTPASTTTATDGDYQEVDSTTIRFIDSLFAGDIVELRINGAGQGIAMVVDHYHANREAPTGVVDGVNRIFYLSRSPKPNSELVFINGILRNSGADEDYAILDNKITFHTAPNSGSKILACYENQYRT